MLSKKKKKKKKYRMKILFSDAEINFERVFCSVR